MLELSVEILRPSSSDGFRMTILSYRKSPRNPIECRKLTAEKSPRKALQVRPDLVFGASSRFVDGNDFVRPEERREHDIAALSKLRGDGFQIFFVETHRADFHGPAGIDQKNRGHI